MRPILDAVVDLHDSLEAAGIPHAFGGAFALLWCTGEPRTTVDIDLNIFTPPTDARRVLERVAGRDRAYGRSGSTSNCRRPVPGDVRRNSR